MKTIYKYPVEIKKEQSILMPEDSDILTVQLQDNEPVIWAIVDTYKPIRYTHIKVYGTGWQEENIDASKYIGTIQAHGLVWHYFYE